MGMLYNKMRKVKRKPVWNMDKLSEKRAKQLADNLGLYAYKKVNGYWAVE